MVSQEIWTCRYYMKCKCKIAKSPKHIVFCRKAHNTHQEWLIEPPFLLIKRAEGLEYLRLIIALPKAFAKLLEITRFYSDICLQNSTLIYGTPRRTAPISARERTTWPSPFLSVFCAFTPRFPLYLIFFSCICIIPLLLYFYAIFFTSSPVLYVLLVFCIIFLFYSAPFLRYLSL
jgi:hypothetical protein